MRKKKIRAEANPELKLQRAKHNLRYRLKHKGFSQKRIEMELEARFGSSEGPREVEKLTQVDLAKELQTIPDPLLIERQRSRDLEREIIDLRRRCRRYLNHIELLLDALGVPVSAI